MKERAMVKKMASNHQNLIDKNALQADIAHIDWEKLSRDGNLDDGINEVLKAIDNAQIVDSAKLIHAYWRSSTFCSHCGHYAEDANGNIIMSSSNYCPACGAVMDEKGSEFNAK
jgi:NADH pyrophosphatase NudC (nudix superfamily)